MKIISVPATVYRIEADRGEIQALIRGCELNVEYLFPNGEVPDTSISGRMLVVLRNALL